GSKLVVYRLLHLRLGMVRVPPAGLSGAKMSRTASASGRRPSRFSRMLQTSIRSFEGSSSVASFFHSKDASPGPVGPPDAMDAPAPRNNDVLSVLIPVARACREIGIARCPHRRRAAAG